MAEAPIQIVDEQDNPIGVAPKQEAWDKGLWHRIVRVMLIDQNGHILLQKRAANKKLSPNCWDDSATGHVDAGEDYTTAVKRELAEELGVVASDHIEKLNIYKVSGLIGGFTVNRFVGVYRLVVDTDTPLNISEDEVSEARWFALDEARQMAMAQPESMTHGLRDVLDRFYS